MPEKRRSSAGDCARLAFVAGQPARSALLKFRWVARGSGTYGFVFVSRYANKKWDVLFLGQRATRLKSSRHMIFHCAAQNKNAIAWHILAYHPLDAGQPA